MGMSGRQTLLSIAVAVAIVAPFSPKVASADQVEAIVTCDNAYGFGWGPTTGMGAGSYSGPVLNTRFRQLP